MASSHSAHSDFTGLGVAVQLKFSRVARFGTIEALSDDGEAVLYIDDRLLIRADVGGIWSEVNVKEATCALSRVGGGKSIAVPVNVTTASSVVDVRATVRGLSRERNPASVGSLIEGTRVSVAFRLVVHVGELDRDLGPLQLERPVFLGFAENPAQPISAAEIAEARGRRSTRLRQKRYAAVGTLPSAVAKVSELELENDTDLQATLILGLESAVGVSADPFRFGGRSVMRSTHAGALTSVRTFVRYSVNEAGGLVVFRWEEWVGSAKERVVEQTFDSDELVAVLDGEGHNHAVKAYVVADRYRDSIKAGLLAAGDLALIAMPVGRAAKFAVRLLPGVARNGMRSSARRGIALLLRASLSTRGVRSLQRTVRVLQQWSFTRDPRWRSIVLRRFADELGPVTKAVGKPGGSLERAFRRLSILLVGQLDEALINIVVSVVRSMPKRAAGSEATVPNVVAEAVTNEVLKSSIGRIFRVAGAPGLLGRLAQGVAEEVASKGFADSERAEFEVAAVVVQAALEDNDLVGELAAAVAGYLYAELQDGGIARLVDLSIQARDASE